MGKKIEFSVDNDCGASAALAAFVAGLSRANADKLVKSGEVRVNGVRIKSNVKLRSGDGVTAFVPDSLLSPVSVKIVYEDENIVVFDKPKHLPFDAIGAVYRGGEIFAAHRLDTNTSGLIVFAKSRAALDELTRAFKARCVTKTYEALVCPAPDIDRAELTAYIKMNGNIASVTDKRTDGYKTMITEYEVVSRTGGCALLRVYPHTGRTHQIRAHMKFIGCPIVGDPKYGGQKIDGAPDTQMLCAVGIKFSDLRAPLEYLNGKSFETGSDFDLSFLK